MQKFCIRRGGFSLVEILTAIAILGILASLIVTVTQSALVNARASQDASNQRQLALGMIAYAQEHSGMFPGTSHGNADAEAVWLTQLRPYVGNVRELAISPLDPKADERLEAGASSYIVNEYAFVPPLDRRGRPMGQMTTLHTLRNPVTFPILFPISESAGVSPQNDHTHSRLWHSWSAVIGDIQPNAIRSGQSDADKTNGRANYAFADGHVASIDAKDLKARFDAGENFAEPQ